MTFDNAKAPMASVWILAVGLIGVALNLSSPASAALLMVIALGPALSLLVMWRQPRAGVVKTRR